MKQIGEVKYSPTLSPMQKKALEVSLNAKIKASTKLSLITELKKAIQAAYLSLSQKPNESKLLTTMLNDLIEYLKNYHSTYTIEEIALAIDLGVKGQLNDITKIPQPIISVTNILKWVDLYNEIHRKNALHGQKLFEEKEAKILTEQKKTEGNRMIEESINNTYLYYRLNNAFPNDGIMSTGLKATWYRFLDKKGLVKPYISLEDKKRILGIAEKEIRRFDELPLPDKQALRPKGRREEWDRHRAIDVVNECQALALEEIFKKALKSGIELFFVH